MIRTDYNVAVGGSLSPRAGGEGGGEDSMPDHTDRMLMVDWRASRHTLQSKPAPNCTLACPAVRNVCWPALEVTVQNNLGLLSVATI